MKQAYQYMITVALIVLFTLIGTLLKTWFDYHSIGYLYLMSVLIVSATFGKGPIFLSAILSALAWNFFFMPPKYSFEIGATQDMLMCYTYFFVATLGGYLNSRIRKHEKLLVLKEESERLYQTLINSISHEIRTPLTAISGNSAALQHEHLLSDTRFVRTTARELHHASERLNQVVANLLDMSRIESGHLALNYEVFSVNDLIEHTISRFRPYLTCHDVKIIRNSPSGLEDLITGDFKLLDHAIGNLLLNSINYSPKGSEIRFEIDNPGSSMRVRVSDQGSGIRKDYQQKVFEKFFRIPGTPTGGVGLGLSIVKGIIDAHAASVGLLDVENGTTFEIVFPKAKLPEAIRVAIS